MNLVELKFLYQFEKGSYNFIPQININKKSRGKYLGMSVIGDDVCNLWMKYHQPPWYIETPLTSQQRRILRLGDIVEEEVISCVENGGGKVSDKQREFQDFDGKFRGHWDGLWEDTHVLEIKSANNNRFNIFKFSNFIYVDFPLYCSQVQMYMHYSNIHNSILVFYNKDNSDLWCKEIKYDKVKAEFLLQKAKFILESKLPIEIPIGEKPCVKCTYKKFCVGG